ncbi:unnamed protein product [Closterium sp. Yama58-4]|nr:unnamed protein product [Closterium sp. Yama58-4]
MAPSFLSCAAFLQIPLIVLPLSVTVHARSLSSRDALRDLQPDANIHESASTPHFKSSAGKLTATSTLQQPSQHSWKRLATSWKLMFRNQRPHESQLEISYRNDNADAGIRNTEAGDGIGLAVTSLSHLFPLRTLASRKQVLGGSGATFFEQDANAGSINNLGVTNSQRSRVGDGMGYASSFQGNTMAQQSATNPTIPTVYAGSSVSTTAATNGVGSSFPFAGLGTTGNVFVGVDGQLIPTGASIGD